MSVTINKRMAIQILKENNIIPKFIYNIQIGHVYAIIEYYDFITHKYNKFVWDLDMSIPQQAPNTNIIQQKAKD